MAGANPYQHTTADCARAFRRIHGNGEQTHVLVVGIDADRYVALAVDVDPVEFQPGAAEPIAYDPTPDGAAEKARRWMETHPKGVLGEDADEGGSLGSKIARFIVEGARKLDDYGDRQVEQMQDQQGGRP